MKKNKADDKLLEAIYESDVELFKVALKEGANVSGVVSEEQEEEFDFIEGESYLSAALYCALTNLINKQHDKKGFNKEAYEKEYADAFEIFNALKALKPDESEAEIDSSEKIESLIEQREMDLADDPYCYGYADFEEEMSEEEWADEDPIVKYLESLKFDETRK